MKSMRLSLQFFSIQMVVLASLSATACFAQTPAPHIDSNLVLELVKDLQEKMATVEVKVILGGSSKDFSITNEESTDKPSQIAYQSQLQAAIQSYREALQSNRNNAEWHFNLSLALARLGESRVAMEELQSAIRLDPNMEKARNIFGALLMENGETEKAENEFKAVIAADPYFVEAKNNLGVLYGSKGRNAEASDLLRLALEERPKYWQAHVNLGLVLAREGKYAEAEKEFRNALLISPHNVSADTALAMVAARLGRADQAIGILQKVIQIEPNSSLAHLNLGIALEQDGFDLPGALGQFSEAVRLNPSSIMGYYEKGRVLYDLGRRQEARTELETACRFKPDYSDALFLLAQVEKQFGNIQRSTELLDRLVSLESGNSRTQHLLGQNLLLLGKTDEAIHHLQIAVAADPANSEALYSLAQALNRAGNPEGKVYLKRFEEQKRQREINDRVQHLGSYGLEAANGRDWPRAVADFREAIELCGNCASLEDLHRNLGLIYILMGDPVEGRRELELALSIRPGDTDARKALEAIQTTQTAPN